jgi:RimJ/RimL family protein N-acetyltransferase
VRLREFVAGDIDELAAMVADPEQMTFYPQPRMREEAAVWLDRNLRLYAEHGYGMWLIESMPGGEFLGYCGIRPLELDGERETEIGWHVRRTAWNRGVATEAAVMAKGRASAEFGIARLVALVPDGHDASRRVAEKIGMRPEGTTVAEGFPYMVYAS